MGTFHGAETLRARRAAGLPLALPLPDDFAETFVLIGRAACEEHYSVGRSTVNRWLNETGEKERLTAERFAYVRSRPGWNQSRSHAIRQCPPGFDEAFVELGLKGCAARYVAHWRTVNRWLEQRGAARLKEARAQYVGRKIRANAAVKRMGRILDFAFPVKGSTLPAGDDGEG